MAFTKKEEKKFKVGNIEIIIGDKYVLDNKFDAGAPEALQKIETTKLPFTGSGVQDAVYFDEMKGLYDTGFYENSNCLQRYTEDDFDIFNKTYVLSGVPKNYKLAIYKGSALRLVGTSTFRFNSI